MSRGGPKGNTKNFQHGAYALLALRTKGRPNGNTKLGRAFRAHEIEYAQDLGGEDILSLAQRQLISDTVWCDLIISSLDFELQNKRRLTRKGKPIPIIELRMRVAAHRRENYKLTGIKRVTIQKSLQQILEEDENEESL